MHLVQVCWIFFDLLSLLFCLQFSVKRVEERAVKNVFTSSKGKTAASNLGNVLHKRVLTEVCDLERSYALTVQVRMPRCLCQTKARSHEQLTSSYARWKFTQRDADNQTLEVPRLSDSLCPDAVSRCPLCLYCNAVVSLTILCCCCKAAGAWQNETNSVNKPAPRWQTFLL